jgi:hypothetical protein
MTQIDKTTKPCVPLLERHKLVQNAKRALCAAFLFSLVLMADSASVFLPPIRTLGPEPYPRLIEQHRLSTALAAGEQRRDEPEATCAVPGPGFSLAYASTILQDLRTMRTSKARTGGASSKRIHIHQDMAHLASHRKRAPAVLAHAGGHHRKPAVASRNIGAIYTADFARSKI